MNALPLLLLVLPLLGVGILAVGLLAIAVCWLHCLALVFGLLFVQAAAWSGLGLALLVLAALLPGAVLGAMATLCYGGACWLFIQLVLGRDGEGANGL